MLPWINRRILGRPHTAARSLYVFADFVARLDSLSLIISNQQFCLQNALRLGRATCRTKLQALSQRTMQTYVVVGRIFPALGEDFDAALVLV
jgi:hypothetical protein